MYLVTDNTTYFVSLEMKNLYFACGINMMYNRNLNITLRSFQRGNHKEWDVGFYQLNQAFNNVVSDATKKMPSEVFFGQRLMHPLINIRGLQDLVWDSVKKVKDVEVIWEELAPKYVDPFLVQKFLNPVTVVIEDVGDSRNLWRPEECDLRMMILERRFSGFDRKLAIGMESWLSCSSEEVILWGDGKRIKAFHMGRRFAVCHCSAMHICGSRRELIFLATCPWMAQMLKCTIEQHREISCRLATCPDGGEPEPQPTRIGARTSVQILAHSCDAASDVRDNVALSGPSLLCLKRKRYFQRLSSLVASLGSLRSQSGAAIARLECKNWLTRVEVRPCSLELLSGGIAEWQAAKLRAHLRQLDWDMAGS
ncbi:hypothetical protein PR048_002407 [Dryococelus australis]|uniref:Uncharacterized protein n=1 Tax=Dryococelus australis TaxID=614101 RepID=A0ABQ9IK40_9NEOP|nr:hypothetical protein PR048_002407 [Dryococelus australis]